MRNIEIKLEIGTLFTKPYGDGWIRTGQKLLFILFFVTLGRKFVKCESRKCQKPLIYCEILEKLPLWADFSKTAPREIS
jgi:hypothetical protein